MKCIHRPSDQSNLKGTRWTHPHLHPPWPGWTHDKEIVVDAGTTDVKRNESLVQGNHISEKNRTRIALHTNIFYKRNSNLVPISPEGLQLAGFKSNWEVRQGPALIAQTTLQTYRLFKIIKWQKMLQSGVLDWPPRWAEDIWFGGPRIHDWLLTCFLKCYT